MRAARVVSQHPAHPLGGLSLEEVPSPAAVPGRTVVQVKASSVNFHDVWTLRGVGHPADRVPMTLGCDAVGTTSDGREVIVHPIFGDPEAGHGDVTLDPRRHILSERIDGGLADEVQVPTSSLIDKPAWLSFTEAASLPVAWGTAYRMLFSRARVKAGQRVLVQGASGGVNSAAIALASAAGAVVYATARSEAKREFARSLGAAESFESGARLPTRVDVVIDNVGAATWSHSIKSLRPGGVLVTCGATSGDPHPTELARIFYQQMSVLGSTGATRSELVDLLAMMEATGLRPTIDSAHPLTDVRAAFERFMSGDAMGKVVVAP